PVQRRLRPRVAVGSCTRIGRTRRGGRGQKPEPCGKPNRKPRANAPWRLNTTRVLDDNARGSASEAKPTRAHGLTSQRPCGYRAKKWEARGMVRLTLC